MSLLPFLKMHGLGNDFVILDLRRHSQPLEPAAVQRIADRRIGVGCDQLVILEPPKGEADVFVRFLNADGSESGACGNASRCVASLVLDQNGGEEVVLETQAGLLPAHRTGGRRIAVDMGAPLSHWQEIPLARGCDTLALPLDGAPGPVVGTSMGNPHATVFVADLDATPIERLGPAYEHDPLFPERANIGFAQVLDRGRLKLKVWERGAGLTLACGSGSCAAAVAAARLGLTGRQVEVILPLGSLFIDWRESDGHVVMTGPVATSFSGALDPSLLLP